MHLFYFKNPDASYIEYSRKLEVKSEKPQETERKVNPKSAKTKSKSKSSKQADVADLNTDDELAKEKEAESSENNDEEIEEEVERPGPEVNTTHDDFIQSLDSASLKKFNDIYTACFTNNPAKLEQLFNSQNEGQVSNEVLLNKRLNKENGFTLLHLVSQKGNADCIWSLLSNGANPALPDLTKKCRLPYYVAINKQTKDQYRRFLNDFPDRYDYTAAQIIEPLRADKLNEKLEKEREKKRNQRKLKKQRENQQKSREKQEEIELNERKRFLELSDQQKRALIEKNFVDTTPLTDAEKIRQQRLQMFDKKATTESTASATASSIAKETLKVVNRCYSCGIDMSKITPFEYLSFKFCSTQCLRTHREQTQKKK